MQGLQKEPGGNRSAWGERLPSISAGFLVRGVVGGMSFAFFLGGVRKVAATESSYPFPAVPVFRDRVCVFRQGLARKFPTPQCHNNLKEPACSCAGLPLIIPGEICLQSPNLKWPSPLLQLLSRFHHRHALHSQIQAAAQPPCHHPPPAHVGQLAGHLIETFHFYLRHKGRLPVRLHSKPEIVRKWAFIQWLAERISG